MSTVSKLQIVLEATTTAFDNGLKKASAALQGFAKKIDDIHSKMDKFARKNKDALNGLQTAGAAAAVGLGVIAVGIKGAVTAAVDFEKSMAGVKKVVNFETPEQFKQMEQDIIALSQRLPMVATDIAAIMEAAGQSGIARVELPRFAEDAIKMGVAFDIAADKAGQAMAELRTSFEMTQDQVVGLADQINYLSNNSTNSAAQILEVVQRIGSVAKTAKVSAATVSALSASLVGVAPDVASTGLKNFFLNLTRGEKLSKSAKEAFKTMGLDYNAVAKGMVEDSEATIRMVLEAAQKVPEHLRLPTLDAAFGSESVAVVAQLVSGYDNVDKHLSAVGDSATYAGSMLKEFESQAGTSAAQMQLFDNNIQAMKIAFGTAFLPVLNQAMEALTPVIKAITDWAQKNPELVTTITAIVAGVLGAIAALGGLALAFTAVTSGIGAMLAIGTMIGGFFSAISTGVGIVSMFGGALAALGFPVAAVVAGIAALVAAGVALYMNWDTVKAKAIEVWNAIPEYASQARQWIQGVWSGVGAWFSGIWDGIKSGASSAWESVKSTASGAFESVKGYASEKLGQAKTTVSNIASDIGSAWDKVKDGAGKAFDNVKSAISEKLGGAKSEAVKAMEGVKSAIASSGVGDAFSKGFDSAKSAVSTAMSGIKSAVTAGITAVKAMIQLNVTGFAIIFNTAFNTIKTVVQTAFGVIKGIVTGDIGAVKSVIQNGLSQLAGIARTAVSQMVAAFRSAGAQMRSVGGDIMQGLINGVKAKIGEFLSTIRSMASQGLATLRGVFRTASPSKATREIGEWVSEGLAIGIAYKAPLAADEAQKMAENVKKAVESEKEALSRSIFSMRQKMAGNPFADLTTDIKFGKYGDPEKQENQKAINEILILKEEERRQQNILSVTERVRDIKQQMNLIGKSNLEVMEWEYQHTDKYLGISREQFDIYKKMNDELQKRQESYEATKEYEKTLADLNKQMALMGNQDPLAEFMYDIEKTGKYAAYTTDQLDNLKQAMQAVQDASAMQSLKNSSADAFGKLRDDTFGGSLTASDKLAADYAQKMTIIDEFESLHTDRVGEAAALRLKIEQEYQDAKNQLILNNAEGIASNLSNITKNMFGEQSKAYKLMFAVEKGVAIARSVMAIQQAIALASANPFPMNLGAMATVASQVGSIVSNIRAVQMPVGQAHDGIMSVPKSGTWNLEKGERVLPRHTAKALDAKLDSMGSGGGRAVNVTVHNYSGEPTKVETDQNGDIRLIVGEELSKQLPQHVNNPNSEFNRSLKNNYQLQRRL